MITRDTIIEFFKDVEQGNEFNTSDKLLWSYFFLDSDMEKLKKFSNKLEELGFKFKTIFNADKINKDDIQEYYLQVEKIELHDVDTLFNLNKMFYKLAEENNINSYDGFDVGNIINFESIVNKS